ARSARGRTIGSSSWAEVLHQRASVTRSRASADGRLHHAQGAAPRFERDHLPLVALRDQPPDRAEHLAQLAGGAGGQVEAEHAGVVVTEEEPAPLLVLDLQEPAEVPAHGLDVGPAPGEDAEAPAPALLDQPA